MGNSPAGYRGSGMGRNSSEGGVRGEEGLGGGRRGRGGIGLLPFSSLPSQARFQRAVDYCRGRLSLGRFMDKFVSAVCFAWRSFFGWSVVQVGCVKLRQLAGLLMD